jgi:hypothetical protein
MVYLFKCANDEDVNLQVRLDDKFIDIRIEDSSLGETQFAYLNESDLFELIGVLHHIQKQLKK